MDPPLLVQEVLEPQISEGREGSEKHHHLRTYLFPGGVLLSHAADLCSERL